MAQITSYKFLRGLDTNSNPLWSTSRDVYGSRSATIIADECVLGRQHMISNRKGFDYFTNPASGSIDALFDYQNVIIQHQADGTLWQGDVTSGSRTQYTGTFTPPSPYRVDATVARGSLFFTSTAGVQKLDAATHTPSRAGLTKGLDVRCTTTGSNGFMNGFSKAAYHVTWLRTDANNQQIRSDVSSRTIVTNNTRQTLTSLTSATGTATATTPLAHGFTTGDLILIAGATQTAYNGTVSITVTGGTTFTYTVAGSPTSPATGTITASRAMNVSLAFTAPWDILSGDFYEVWRTVTVDASNADPGDDCYLVSRSTTSSTAGSTITFVDTTPDSIISASTALYTNSTQQGALQGNSRPPVATCACTYKDYLILGNTAIDHQISLGLLATINFVAGSSSITLNCGTITKTYTFNTSENVGTRTAQIFTGGLSNAANIESTTRSLVHVINGDSTGQWYAEYTSGPNDNPGLFRLWARSPLTGQFWLTASDSTTGAQFTPSIPTSGQTTASSNDQRANRLFYSKFQAPDSVPILNTIDVGRLDQPILRVLAVRDACYIVKADGIWYLSGLVAPFSLVELDSTCHCIAPATACTLNNQIFMLSNQGVVQVSVSGVTVISFDIEPNIMSSVLPLTSLATVAFAVSHESQRQYMLWLPSANGDTYAKQAYIFHAFVQEWTHWNKPASTGIAMNTNRTLYIGSGQENALLKQRATGTIADYSDEELPITVTGQTGTTVTATWSAGIFTPTAGISLHQGSAVAKVLTATLVSGTTWQFGIDRTVSFANGAATARMPIYAHVRLSPAICGDTGISKAIYTTGFYLESSTVTQAQIEVCTNEAPSYMAFPVTRPIVGGWGTGVWATSQWGDLANPAQSVPWLIDLPIPDHTGETVSAGWIHHVSQEPFVLVQVSFSYDQLAELETTPVTS